MRPLWTVIERKIPKVKEIKKCQIIWARTRKVEE